MHETRDDTSISVAGTNHQESRYMTKGMCPGLGEWWLHKQVLNLQNFVIFNIFVMVEV